MNEQAPRYANSLWLRLYDRDRRDLQPCRVPKPLNLLCHPKMLAIVSAEVIGFSVSVVSLMTYK